MNQVHDIQHYPTKFDAPIMSSSCGAHLFPSKDGISLLPATARWPGKLNVGGISDKSVLGWHRGLQCSGKKVKYYPHSTVVLYTCPI